MNNAKNSFFADFPFSADPGTTDFSLFLPPTSTTVKYLSIKLIYKRLFDIIASIALIIMLSPLLIITAVLIKTTSKGSIFFMSERFGYKGRIFYCFKFRSMIAHSPLTSKDLQKAQSLKKQGILYKVKDDDRITRVGAFIRKTSIDELPQLFNVLRGEMSIIGPRPLDRFMLKNYPEFNKIRGSVKPGITGLWQIRNRENNTSAEYMIKDDLEYISNLGFITDAKILLQTPLVVIKGRGAF
jgi:exopolysaccharide production protein ExoY